MEIRSARRGIVIAGTSSGAGKTTVTLGIMAAFRRRGLTVQGFKCGPDYIDPTYHKAVTGRPSRNLDSWMLSHEAVRELYCRASADADIAVTEGVMGFYDGKDPLSNTGSTAEISMLLQCPVLLVVNCQSMARSAAAVVKGFQLLDPRVRIGAVFANKVGSEGHYRIVKEAIEQACGVPVIGYLTREEELTVPERHLGLVPAIERGEHEGLFASLADRIERTTDLDKLLALASETKPVEIERPLLFAPPKPSELQEVTIAVARDAAFHFYYPENIELLELHGARIRYFSPLLGEPLPESVDGLYIGGGFPEEFAGTLSKQEHVKRSIRQAVEDGLPTLAECGGFMYLTEAIEDTRGGSFPMLGVIPGKVTMQSKLAALGYREVTGMEGNFLLGPGEQARGHEFHYSTFRRGAELPHAYESRGLRGTKPEGCLLHRLVAGYTHLHFASCPKMARRWLEVCASYREQRMKS